MIILWYLINFTSVRYKAGLINCSSLVNKSFYISQGLVA